MNAKDQKELLALIEGALTNARGLVESLHSERGNSSVTDTYYKAQGRIDALEAVRDAIKGNKVMLKMYART